ncbi:outer membrane protein beta-barrel domain protein [Kordia sp. SMS9]|uniref:outer membrane beta-barrel protein n=1 Tax=Kordia sp. SMS9 TaxID=2282170 RepID=UPI000E0DB788|nr:outer membrane beta-barrel protein [Kordia sp. SMS9]AXG69182.1 outer membrane protein beta-barrel domain protein [Kordia sp. SMS9]
MKKNILYISLLIVAFVHAQEVDTQTSDKLRFEKHTQFINTNFSISVTNQETRSLTANTTVDEKRNSYNFQVSYAYGIAENLFLGAGLGYGHEVTTFGSNSVIGNRYRILPFVRYYKGIGKRLALYLQGEVSLQHTNVDRSKENSFSAGLRPGITLMLNKKLALETSIGFFGYSSSNFEGDNIPSERDNKAINLSLNSSNLLFGLNYYF